MRILSKYIIIIFSAIRFLKNIIHHSLEYNRAVSHTKECYQEFEESVVSTKYGLSLVTYFDLHIIKTLANV